jgi:F0F1-type ATP synthase epsilon subunit
MKSAFELALERSGGALENIDNDKKKRITEIDTLYKSKLAEAKLSASERLKKATSHEDAKQIEEDLAVEIASINSKMEQEKEAVRNG